MYNNSRRRDDTHGQAVLKYVATGFLVLIHLIDPESITNPDFITMTNKILRGGL